MTLRLLVNDHLYLQTQLRTLKKKKKRTKNNNLQAHLCGLEAAFNFQNTAGVSVALR